MKKVKTLYYGLWDNYGDNNHPERVKAVDEVIEAVIEHGEVDVSFSYTGRTKHELASRSMMDELMARGYDFSASIEGYNFTICKNKS